jgi:hypothetical protein
MFVFNRSAATVIVPLALLLAVVLWSGGSASPGHAPVTARAAQPSQEVTMARVDRPRHSDAHDGG